MFKKRMALFLGVLLVPSLIFAAATLFPEPKFQAFDSNGDPLSGGLVFTYDTGTTNKKTTWTDSTKGTPNANPVVLDTAGRANIWLDGQYRVVLAPSTDSDPPVAPIWTVDNVDSILSSIGSDTTFLVEHTSAGRHLDPDASSYTDFATAILTLGSTEATLSISDSQTVSANVTIPVTLTLNFKQGGSLSIASAITVTIEGTVIAGRYTIFAGASTTPVKFGAADAYTKTPVIYPEWFGAAGDYFQGTPGDNTTYAGTDDLAALDKAIASLQVHGGTIDMGESFFGISGPWEVFLSTLDSADRVTIMGNFDNNRNAAIILDNGDADEAAISYDNSGGGGHILSLKNLFIYSTATISEGTAWHDGTGVLIKDGRVEIDNLNVRGFTECVDADGASYSFIRRSRFKLCMEGVTIDDPMTPFLIERNDFQDCANAGTPANGWGLKIIRASGGTINSNEFASSASVGLECESCRGVSIVGNNFETFESSRAIRIRGNQTDTEYSDIENWSTGVDISGNRCWNARCIQIEDGAGWITIDGNTMINNYPDSATQLKAVASGSNSINASLSDPLTVMNINYTSNNHWLHDVEPTLHRSSGFGHAFTKDGYSMFTSIASRGTFEAADIIYNRSNPSFKWIFDKYGTFGTLNSGATTGSVATGIDTQLLILSDMTGIYPGVAVTIAGAGVASANLDVIIGGCTDSDKECEFFPAASTTVAAAAISYNAPLYTLSGMDLQAQAVAFASTIDIDLTDGAYVIVGELTGAITINAPSGETIGQHFWIHLDTDGTGRTPTFNAEYKTTISAVQINANKTKIVEFVVIDGTHHNQVGTPVEITP